MLYEHRSTFGEIQIVEHDYFGRMLIIDGVVQLTERDEYFYHEMLSHVPLHAHSSPSDVLIIGGGDGGTLREVLKHKRVKRELDKEVIEASRRFLPTLSTGFNDPRTKVVISEGSKFISQQKEAFDIVLLDSTDPVGPAKSLFTKSFFSDVHSALKADGILAAQTESLHFHLDFICDVHHRLKQAFGIVDLYTVPMATYAGNWWTFSIASEYVDPRELALPCHVPTRYYAEDVHRNAFLAPSLYQRMIDRKRHIH
jgi:spermidine synthase